MSEEEKSWWSKIAKAVITIKTTRISLPKRSDLQAVAAVSAAAAVADLVAEAQADSVAADLQEGVRAEVGRCVTNPVEYASNHASSDCKTREASTLSFARDFIAPKFETTLSPECRNRSTKN